MKKILLIAAATLMMAGTAQAQTQKPETYPSYIQVTGEAELEIEPNEIYVNITIDETTSRGKVTVADQERKMIAALRKLGINTDRDLQVGDMSGELQSYIIRRDRVQTSKSYLLKVTSADMLGRVFAELASLNISDMKLSKVTRDDLPQIKMRLRGEAIKAAKANAEALAGAIGQTVGKAFNISDYNSFGGGEMIMYDNAPMLRSANVQLEQSASQDDPLSFRNLKLNYSVTARFILE